MVVAAQVLGGFIALAGFIESIVMVDTSLTAFRKAVHPIENDNSCKKVMRVAAEALKSVGLLVASIGAVVVGVGMVAVAPQLGFFASLLTATQALVPYLAGSLACLTASALSSIYGGSPYVPPEQQGVRV